MSYIDKITECQPLLKGYIISRIYNFWDASDVLQETNSVLLLKEADYDSSRNFKQWALGIASWQIKAYLKSYKRNREHPYVYLDSTRKCPNMALDKFFEGGGLSTNRHTTSSSFDEYAEADFNLTAEFLTLVDPSELFPDELLSQDKELLLSKLYKNLNSREKIFLEEIIKGSTLDEIAKKVNSSRNATSTYKSRLIVKLKKKMGLIKAENKYDHNY